MKNLKTAISLILFVVAFVATTNSVYATQNVTSPSFPSCTDLNTDGDWVTADSGFHHIPGQEAPIEGSDDVYYLEGGNFVQCLCPKNPEIEGIQTNWWKIDDNLTQNQIDDYVDLGWFFEFGGNWNLIHTDYLAQNTNYSCNEVPEPTPTPTATPTPSDHSSECTNIAASVTSGSAPLTVSFQGEGYDSEGYIEEYEFSFNDNSDGQPSVYKTKDSSAAHRYVNEGTYTVKLKVKDSKGVWKEGDKCEVTINVSSTPQVLGASTSNQLPETGAENIWLFGSLALIAAGGLLYYKYSR